MRALAPVVLLVASLSGQEVAKPYQLRQGSGDFAAWEVDRLSGTLRAYTFFTSMAGIGRHGDPGISLGWGLVRPTTGDSAWVIAVRYEGSDWAFIGNTDRPVIEFLADGERISVPVRSEPDRDVNTPTTRSVRVTELATGTTDAATLFKLARADSVYWRVTGRERTLEGDANPENLERLRRFLATFFPDSTVYVKRCEGRRRERCT